MRCLIVVGKIATKAVLQLQRRQYQPHSTAKNMQQQPKRTRKRWKRTRVSANNQVKW